MSRRSGWVMFGVVALLALPAGAGENTALPSGIVRDGTGYRSSKDGMPLVLVPAGDCELGSEVGRYDERPVHRVYLDAFLIDVHEVTNAQFARFVREAGYAAAGPWRRGFARGAQKRPVRFVTWHDARAYAVWAGRALPTAAQWERAARGADGGRYPWGSEWEAARARVNLAVEAGPADVGSHPDGASPAGCLDMAGNVWEWVADWYDRYAYRARAGATLARNPTGPPDGAPVERRFRESKTAGGNERSTRKEIRGGGWVRGGRENARAAKRMQGNPRYWFNDTGFRCAIGLARGAEPVGGKR